MSLLRMPVLAALVLILAGCSIFGGSKKAIVIQPEPAPVLALAPPPPLEVSPINRNLSPAATLWHFRVALNVAALACRGGPELQIIADYNAMLGTQKAALAAAQSALTAEYRARGGNWQDAQDDAMTRLYNFFSQAQAREAFCITSSEVLAQARTVPAGGLGMFASQKLATLDAPFSRMMAMPRPVIALAASPIAAPPAVPAASRPAPRLAVDTRALQK